MLIALPMISILALITKRHIRESFFLSLVINGLFVAVSTEILSILGALSSRGVIVSWVLFIIATVAMRSIIHRSFTLDTLPEPEQASLTSKGMIAVLVGLFGLLGFTAVVAAPNNWDSFTYHLPRILHWIQNGSVAHYPTHITRQLIMPPWSEYTMMHLFLLSSSDRFVNCVQWLSMVGSCVGISLVVKRLGGSLGQQYSAMLVAATLPIGLLEATSTQNDYALAVWCVAVLLYFLDAKEKLTWQAALLCSVSLALALMTKGTGYIILFPVVLVSIVTLTKKNGVTALMQKLSVGTLIVLVLNSGVYWRNWTVFGSPLTTDEVTIVNTSADPRIAAIAVVRSLGVHLASSFQAVNSALYSASISAHKIMGVDINDPRLFTGYNYQVFPYRNHEDYASNPLHMILFLGGVFATVALRRRLDRRVLWYTAIVFGSFVALSVMIRWNVWLSRIFVPVFILAAPIPVLSFRPIIQKHIACVALVILACVGGYVSITNETRPLVGHMSILKRDRLDQYFANAPDLRSYYMQQLTKAVMSGSNNIGLAKLNGDVWEYPVWVMLSSMGNRPYRIEHVNVQNRSKAIPLKGQFSPSVDLVL